MASEQFFERLPKLLNEEHHDTEVETVLLLARWKNGKAYLLTPVPTRWVIRELKKLVIDLEFELEEQQKQ